MASFGAHGDAHCSTHDPAHSGHTAEQVQPTEGMAVPDHGCDSVGDHGLSSAGIEHICYGLSTVIPQQPRQDDALVIPRARKEAESDGSRSKGAMMIWLDQLLNNDAVDRFR